MESIEQMIKRLCPEGVPMVKIGDVCTCYAGATPDTKNPQYWEDGTIQWMSSGEVNKGQVFATEKKITQLGYDKSSTKMVPINSVVVALAGQGKTRGTVAITRTELCTNQSLCAIIPNDQLIADYLFHYLKSQYQTLRSISCGDGTRGGLNLKMINAFQIPLPPLSIQSRIVEVLDKMTTLTAELEAELEARKQQYEYYRNKLLTFNELGGGTRQVTWKKISEIGTVMRGTSFQKKHFTDEGTPCIHYGQIYTQYAHHAYKTFSFVGDEISRSPRRAKTGALVMATTSENIEDVGKCIVWLGEEDVIVSNDACFIQHSLNPKYLGYLLQTESFSNYKKKVATGTKVIRINADAVADFVIPVPSMEEQERIVSILDRFEALTTDLQSGLPAEIEARRQQYEYYRNKLLSFKQVV